MELQRKEAILRQKYALTKGITIGLLTFNQNQEKIVFQMLHCITMLNLFEFWPNLTIPMIGLFILTLVYFKSFSL